MYVFLNVCLNYEEYQEYHIQDRVIKEKHVDEKKT